MTEDSIDIQPLSGSDSARTNVRQSFRVPVSEKENLLARISGKAYSVANISAFGIAIRADSCLEFEEGQILPETELWLDNTLLMKITGKVIHCSVHNEGFLQFGIQWRNLSDQEQRSLEATVGALKARMMKKD